VDPEIVLPNSLRASWWRRQGGASFFAAAAKNVVGITEPALHSACSIPRPHKRTASLGYRKFFFCWAQASYPGRLRWMLRRLPQCHRHHVDSRGAMLPLQGWRTTYPLIMHLLSTVNGGSARFNRLAFVAAAPRQEATNCVAHEMRRPGCGAVNKPSSPGGGAGQVQTLDSALMIDSQCRYGQPAAALHWAA